MKDKNWSYMFLGSYPQTLKSENVKIVSDIANEKGYYKGSDGNLYAKQIGAPYEEGLRFKNGEEIEENKVYYFKVEPIKWMVLQKEEDDMFLLCDQIIDINIFDLKTNDYKNSSVRKYLNDEFINKAFTPEEKQKIKETLIKIDESTLEEDSEINAKEKCIDKVFLLSLEDIKNQDLGFDNNERFSISRQKQGSDYSLAKGMCEFCDKGWYYLRTSIIGEKTSVNYVYFDGNIGIIDVYYKDGGIAPAIHIKVN